MRGTGPRTRTKQGSHRKLLIAVLDAHATGSQGPAVLMGDSTMSGVVEELTTIADGEGRASEVIYVSNDRPKRVLYGCNADCGGVPAGGEWKADPDVLNDVMTQLTVKRAENSTKALHSQGCQSGGGLETYAFRSGPFKNLVIHHWGFLPEYTDFCWKPCMTNAMAALKPTAVVWNIGFHLLNHDFKPSVCETRYNPTKTGCGDYKNMVHTATKQMISAGIGNVVWKHTNWLCEDRQKEGFPLTADSLDKWNNRTNRAALEKQCEIDCPKYAAAGMTCYDWFFNAETTTRMYLQSKAALKTLRDEFGSEAVREVDSYRMTKECCSGGCKEETEDGEHYMGLDSAVALELARVLRK